MTPKYKVVNLDRKSIVTANFDKYSLHYKTGDIVKAKENTLGIFCFKTKKEAVTYINKDFNPLLDNRYLLVKVLPLKKGKEPKVVADAFNQECIQEFYDNGKWNTPPQKGTICYPEVLVLD